MRAGRMASESQNTTALPLTIYIAGYGRSGSTILDVLLSQSEDVVGGVSARVAAGDVLCTSHQVGGNRLRLQRELVFRKTA